MAVACINMGSEGGVWKTEKTSNCHIPANTKICTETKNISKGQRARQLTTEKKLDTRQKFIC